MRINKRILAGIAIGLASFAPLEAQLSRPGVAHLDARRVVFSVFPDSLDGVHLDLRILHKKDWIRHSSRFRPEAVRAWVKTAESLRRASTSDSSIAPSFQSPVLASLEGTLGVVLARHQRGKRDFYWLLHRLEETEPLLIEADAHFTDTLLTSLREAAQLSAIDSTAFESGLVAPLHQRPDSLDPWPIKIPTPKYPGRLGAAGRDGLVQVRFVIDTDGRVDMKTFEVLWASNSEFIPPVQAALSRGRFRPARLGGKAVRQRVYQDARFRIHGQRAHWN